MTCPIGVTVAELEQELGAEMYRFKKWMRGQTVALCDGRQYNHTTREYEETECAKSPHGVVVYRSDLERFQAGYSRRRLR